MSELTSRSRAEPSHRSNRQFGKDSLNEFVKCSEAETIEDILNNPIKSGYFLAYCESQYSAENLRYILEIDRFHDLMTIDKGSWQSGLEWNDIDDTLGLSLGDDLPDSGLKAVICDENLVIGKEEFWPSRKVHFSGVVDHITKIWNQFLSPNAPEQICK
jgi:hypothetical protein